MGKKILSLLFSLSFATSSYPCSTFFVTGSPGAIVAKNLDWYTGQGNLYINKKGVQKTSIFVGKQKPMTWISTHASITLTQTGLEFPWEGMNDSGVSVGSLQLIPSVVPPSTDPRPAIDFTQWIQYILDTSSDLKEAVKNAKKTRVAEGITIHYFVCDSHSDCAVFEYIDGELVISKEDDLPYAALTNNTYSDSLSYFNEQLLSFIPKVILEKASAVSLDRFSRAALWSSRFNPTKDNEINYAFSGLQNLSQSNPYLKTYWNLVFGLKSKTMYLKTADAPKLKTISLSQFDAKCSSGVQMADLNLALEGDITPKFIPYTSESNLSLVNQSQILTAENKKKVASYPKEYTQCIPSN